MAKERKEIRKSPSENRLWLQVNGEKKKTEYYTFYECLLLVFEANLELNSILFLRYFCWYFSALFSGNLNLIIKLYRNHYPNMVKIRFYLIFFFSH